MRTETKILFPLQIRPRAVSLLLEIRRENERDGMRDIGAASGEAASRE